MQAEKNALREEFMRRRDGISSGLLQIYNNAIRTRLARIPEFSEAKTIAGYSAIGSEVGTKDILRDILARQIQLCLPCTNTDGTLKLKSVLDIDKSLEDGAFGISEPRQMCKDCTKPDIVLVPAICVTPECDRIGYGRGYYDRYLADNDVFSIGLVYELQIVKSIPSEVHDVPLDMLVSEKRTYRH